MRDEDLSAMYPKGACRRAEEPFKRAKDKGGWLYAEGG